MSARIPTARTVRRAVNTLAQLPAEVLAQLAEAIIDRLDAAEPDPDLEEDNEDRCMADEDNLGRAYLRTTPADIGDADDAEFNGDDEPDDHPEPNADDEEDDPQGDGYASDGDMPVFPARDPGTLRAERDGLVTVFRRLRAIVMVTSVGGRPTRVRTMRVRRFA